MHYIASQLVQVTAPPSDLIILHPLFPFFPTVDKTRRDRKAVRRQQRVQQLRKVFRLLLIWYIQQDLERGSHGNKSSLVRVLVDICERKSKPVESAKYPFDLISVDRAKNRQIPQQLFVAQACAGVRHVLRSQEVQLVETRRRPKSTEVAKRQRTTTDQMAGRVPRNCL